MDQKDFGIRIAELRRKAGYTQVQLAAALSITDKAISKWERGLCLPDSTTLPRLAGLLDTDLGSLIPDIRKTEPWKGVLILKNGETNAMTQINDKPLIHYLLSYFLLLEITDVTIITDQFDSLSQLSLSDYGFKITNQLPSSGKVFAVYGKTLLFGSYLTQQLTNMMAASEDIIPIIDGVEVPFLFTHHWEHDAINHLEHTKRRSLYRGMINLPLNTLNQADEATTFIHIYEKNHPVSFCNLKEIAKSRGIFCG